MKKLLIPFAALALLLVGCNKDGTDSTLGGDATPASSNSIVGKWYYPNELIDLTVQPEFNFSADGKVTGNYYEGTWSINEAGVLIINTKDWEGNDQTVYVRPYTMYNNTVLILHYDVPELDKDGFPVINQGQGWTDFFYKDGKAAANDKADIQGTWENVEEWDSDGDGVIDESMKSVTVKFDGDKFDLIIHVWHDESYSGTYTYKNGFVYFHPTKYVTSEGEMDPKEGYGYDNGGDFVFPFIGNGDEAYAYIIEGWGAWKKAN